MDNCKRFTDRCGNCAFSRPVEIDSDKVECIMGGTVSLPMSKDRTPCLAYRPNVKEARRRNGILQTAPKGRPRKETVRLKVIWTDEMDDTLEELCGNNLYTIKDIARQMGLEKRDVVLRINELGIERRPVGHASKAKSVFHDGNNLPLTKQKYPRIKCCKGLCCKYKEQCAHYAHWLEMGKPQFDTINSVGTCINIPYSSGAVRSETLYTFREFISLDMKSRTPEPTTYSEIP